MVSSDALTESEIRGVVRDEMPRAIWSVLSALFWTILSLLGILFGLQAIQLAFLSTGLAAVGFVAFGVLAAGASIYLLYLLHWR